MKRALAGFLFCCLSPILAAPQNEAKIIELILDASGSMNARLPDGTTRLDAARQAVSQLVNSLPSDTTFSFRAYGHQSPREKHDCNDTQVLVPFGPLGSARSKITSSATQVKAQGYTPITRVITLAASDFPPTTAGERTIVLVSDGKETCEGDPCAAARALAKTNTGLVIHTVGFGVDDAARLQLRCIARATRGTYFDAENAGELTKALGMAAIAKLQKLEPEKKGGGYLQIKQADSGGHDVTDAETGKRVSTISSVKPTVNLPAGIYNVTFGSAIWKSVDVKNGETTVLEPGVLQLNLGSIAGHDVMDSETGQRHGMIMSIKNSITLMPGLYDVTFGGAVWPVVRVNSGKVTALNAGVIKVAGARITGHRIFDADGKQIGEVTSMANSMSLPPGKYAIEIGGKKEAFALAEGQELTLTNKQ